MGNILRDGFCDKNGPFVLKLKIELTAHDVTCLLIDFLSEVLSTSYAEKAFYCEVDFFQLTTKKISHRTDNDHLKKPPKNVTF